jgi:diacylglycerol kinase family enzyme
MAPAEAGSTHAGPRVAVIANMEKMSEEDAGKLRCALEAYGITNQDWIELTQGADVKQSVARAVKAGAKTIVVCGGDGSVRLAAEALSGTGVALSVVPEGTGNVFVAGLDLPTDLDEIAKAVATGNRKTIDTGTCNGETFNLMAGSGFDVGMMSPSDEEKARLGFLAYIRAAIGEMLSRRSFQVEVAIDDTPFYSGPSSGVFAAKLGSKKGFVETFPDASPTDGLLHVAVVTAVGPWEWLGLIALALVRRQKHSSEAKVGQGAKVSAVFGTSRQFELDGDIQGRTTKLECEAKPGSLVICTPKD